MSTASELGGVPGSPEALRHAMGHFASGVTVVTAEVDGVRHAMTATAVCSVSLEPPLILVCVSHTSRFHAAVLEAGAWAVSVLGADQERLARHFSRRGRELATQFDGVATVPAPHSGAPVLAGSLVWLDCETSAVHAGGDHTIVVGQVRAASGAAGVVRPLSYYRSEYGQL